MPPVNVNKHKALDTYDAALANYNLQGVTHEQATRLAFSTLLDTLAKTVGWTLVLEQTLTNRKRPDGTLVDSFKIPRGYWEAKDTQDDLDAEIQAKIRRGYPLTNTIFEDTRRAVLYQNGRPVFEADLSQRSQLAALLSAFFSYTGEQIEEFHAAVREFQARIPELAQGLLARIEQERETSKRFIGAFEAFHTICKQAIDPQISVTDVEVMLVQHLLTERLFRTIFDNADFTRRNVIAAEIEKVIDALTSRAFNRREFLKALDYFYLAIEEAAATISDFAQKQTFLNTVYERFFQGFSKDQADTHGIVYTPQPIVDFMVASVDEVLQREFGLALSAPGVKILDPCTGTGNFIVNILRRLNRRDLKQKYREDLFANEIMLLPYYIAALNIEHAYYELTGEYEPFEGICFTDTLDLAESQQLSLFAEENTERVERQKHAEITVIIGNPPYNVGQRNENDNNKNRRYKTIDEQVRQTYAKDSRATNKNALDDVYVKFLRWATERLHGRDGIVCYVSNNSFIDQLAFDGVRKHLLQDFTQIYHLDLHGNVRRNPKLSGSKHNVFGIQVGVGITIAVRSSKLESRKFHYFRVPEGWTAREKLSWLTQRRNVCEVEWRELTSDIFNTWITDGMRDEFATFLPVGTKEAKSERGTDIFAIFKNYGRGVATSRDVWAYAFEHNALAMRMRRSIEHYNTELDRWLRRTDRNIKVDDFVEYSDAKIKWSRDLKLDLQRGNYANFSDEKLRSSLYRPFCKRYLFFDRVMNEEVYQQPKCFPTVASESENALICVPGPGNRMTFGCLITNYIPALDLAFEKTQCFPFYVYDEDGTNRRENITDWALAQYQAQYGAGVTKRDIFNYVYAVLHHPQYRERYAENLKRELPRIPFVAREDFQAFVDTGAKLAELHLGYEAAPEYPLNWIENKAIPFSWRVTKMKLTPAKDAVVVNESLTLAGLPPECFAYRLGNRSALEWVIDQYRVSTDKRSGITSDPNRDDDEEYIVRLIGRVVTVSVETVKLIKGLPAKVVAAEA